MTAIFWSCWISCFRHGNN